MRRIGLRLERAGLHVCNLDYPSRSRSIDELVEMLDEGVACLEARSDSTVHFVTHSMGGILVRAYLARSRPPNLGRVVMLSPPNRGSELVDVLGGTWWFRTFLGPAAVELGTGPDSLPNRLGPADFELGVVMGSRSLNPLGSWFIPGADDGTVSVESAKLAGMRDFLLVRRSHTFIMLDDVVADATLHFLRHGRFPVRSQRAGDDDVRGSDADGAVSSAVRP